MSGDDDKATSNGVEEPEKTEEKASPADEEKPLKPAKKKGGAKAKAAKGKGKKKGKNAAKAEEGKAEGGEEEGGEEGEKKKKKPAKKLIPFWASVPDAAKAASRGPTGSSGVSIIITAIEENADAKGLASYIAIKKHVLKHHPAWPKMVFKSALRRSVQNGKVKQIKSSYKVLPDAKGDKATAKVEKKISKSRSKTVTVSKDCPLEELFPHIFTWVCEPKEASYGLIRKYIGKHFPNLSTEGNFKKAMENMVAKGQLDQITGKGACGTFQLVDGAKKTGTAYEDPVEDAIIASNEPKTASVPALRHYLSEYHTEYGVADKPKVLQRALEKAENLGWIFRVTGKGFSGTFQLSYPYIPSPRDLWRGDYKEADYEPKKRVKYTQDTSDEEESEEETESEEEVGSSDYDSDVEVIPKKKKRGAPAPRDGPAPPKKARKPKAKGKTAKPAKAKASKSAKAADDSAESAAATEDSADDEEMKVAKKKATPKKGKKSKSKKRKA